MPPSGAAALSLGESYRMSRPQSKQQDTLSYRPWTSRLSMFPVRAYIEFLISLRLSLLGRKQMPLNWPSLIFKCHHRWVRIEGSGMAKACQQIGLI